MHWTYKEPHEQEASTLEQGDLLEKTPELIEILKKYHPYYATHADNLFFMVVTQSCDLVLRNGSECKSRYISLAPVRAVKAVLKREFDDKLFNSEPGAQPYASVKTKTTIEQFLERLYNNNEPSFFFYEQNPTAGVSEPMCGILSLAISIKSEHYQTCFTARRLSIKDEFQAKVGWLIGQLFSRVGTRDWPTLEMKAKVAASSEKYALWVNESDVAALNKQCAQAKQENPDAVIDAKQLVALISGLPKRKEIIINAILAAATQVGIFPPLPAKDPNRRKLRQALENDPTLSGYFK